MKPKMTRAEYRRALRALDCGVLQAGRVFGTSTTTASRYWNGRSSVPQSLAMLIRLTIATRTPLDQLSKLANGNGRRAR